MGKRRLSKKGLITIAIFITIVDIILFSSFGKTKQKEEITFTVKEDSRGSYPVFNSEKLNQAIEEVRKKEITIYETSIIDSYISIIYQKEDGTYQNKFIDQKTGEEVKITEFLDFDILKEKLPGLLQKKYPSFLVDGAMDALSQSAFHIKRDQITIYFNQVKTNPEVSDKISITIANQDIKDALKYSYQINEECQTESFTLSKEKKTIALTFDDGPSTYTKEIMETLKDNHMNATFFVLGSKIEKYADVIKEQIALGNEIGSHTYSHKYLTKIDEEAVQNEIRMTNEAYKKVTGKDIKLTRPPYGSINDEVKNELNTIFITWNVDTEDWRSKNVTSIVNRVMDDVSDGSIVLMHDVYETSKEAVKTLLPRLYAEGYQVVSVSKLAELKGKELQTHEIYKYIK